MENNKIKIIGYAYWDTEPNHHLPIPVRPEAFDAPIKSIELCVEDDLEITVVEFERPVTKMSENIFALTKPRLKEGYSEDTPVKWGEGWKRWEFLKIDSEDFTIKLPDTLVDYLPIDDEQWHDFSTQKHFLSRINEPLLLIDGKYACEGGDYWAVDGNMLFWTPNLYDDFGVDLRELTDVKSVPPYFYTKTDLKGKLILPPNLEKMGERAFSSMKCIKSIKMPKTLKAIPPNTVVDNDNLTEISLAYIEEIGENAFSNCGLKRVKLSKNLKKIGEGVFSNCVNPIFTGPEKFVRENGTSLVSDNVMILFPHFKGSPGKPCV